MTKYAAWVLYFAIVPVLVSFLVVNSVSANDTHNASAPSRVQHRIHYRLKRISHGIDRVGRKIHRKVNRKIKQIHHRVNHARNDAHHDSGSEE